MHNTNLFKRGSDFLESIAASTKEFKRFLYLNLNLFEWLVVYRPWVKSVINSGSQFNNSNSQKGAYAQDTLRYDFQTINWVRTRRTLLATTFK